MVRKALVEHVPKLLEALHSTSPQSASLMLLMIRCEEPLSECFMLCLWPSKISQKFLNLHEIVNNNINNNDDDNDDDNDNNNNNDNGGNVRLTDGLRSF